MNRFVSLASVSLAVIAAGCASAKIGEPSGPEVPLVRLRAEPYSFTFNSGLNTQQRLVVRDPDTWRVVWSEIWLHNSPLPVLPAVDFSREMIVVAALGARGTGGFSILLVGASEAAGDGTVVTVDSNSPGPGCLTTQAFTQPVDIGRIPLRAGPISFIERSHVTNCGN